MPEQNEKGWIARALASGSLKAAAYHATITYFIPLATPLITGWLGYMQGLPLMYIFLGALFAFAAVATALLRYDEWLFRRAVENKLAFSSVRVGRNIHGPGMFLGLQLQSTALFPIDFQMQEIRTQIGNVVPSSRTQNYSRIEVPPNGLAWWDDNIINFTVPSRGTIEGFMDYRYRYGRSTGALSNEKAGRKQVTLAFDDSGNIVHVSVNDAN